MNAGLEGTAESEDTHEKSGQMGPEETSGRHSLGSWAERGRKAWQRGEEPPSFIKTRASWSRQIRVLPKQTVYEIKCNAFVSGSAFNGLFDRRGIPTPQTEQLSQLKWSSIRPSGTRQQSATRPLWPSNGKKLQNLLLCSCFCHTEQSRILSVSPLLQIIRNRRKLWETGDDTMVEFKH